MGATEDSARAFERGNFTKVLTYGSPETWQWHASLGLIGRTVEALEGLARFNDPQARFYEGVTLWIAGDEIEAKRVLARVPTDHARRLLELIAKPAVRVLAMMPAGTSGPHLVYRGALQDPKFEIDNILVSHDGSGSDEISARMIESGRPDFFVCQMIEWHQIPLTLRSFPCPTIGHTSDFDLHIQGLHGWLRAFDELMVCDHDEHDAVAGLTDTPISVFPKSFACPAALPRPLRRERVFDVFLSGTLFHPWHPDKARLIHQLLGEDGIRFLGFNGYLPEREYFETIARSRMCVAYYRRDGGMLTRAIESAAMGCVTLVPRGSVVNLFTQPRGALVEYDTATADGLVQCIKSVLAQYDGHEQRAWRSATDLRRELNADLVGSQYMRFCAFLAARPRKPRPVVAPRDLDQRHLTVIKGWLPDGGRLAGMRKLAAGNIRSWRQSMRQPQERFDAINNILRERLLMYIRQLALTKRASWRARPFEIRRSDFPRPAARTRLLEDYRRACAEYPDRLVMIFNYLRAAIHCGSDGELADALKFLTATLARPADEWRVEPEDDVLPYDVFPLCFNYRRYGDLVCEILSAKQASCAPLVKLMRASLHYYRARLQGSIDDARGAHALDPEFPYFALNFARRVASSGSAQDSREAEEILTSLIRGSMVASEAGAVLTRLRLGGEVASLAARTRRVRDSVIPSEQYLWEPGNILSTIQVPHPHGSLGARVLQNTANGASPKRFSVVFVDEAFKRWEQYARLLGRQSAKRSAFESIIADTYDDAPPGVESAFDTILLCGQSDFLAERASAANNASCIAQSEILLFVDGVPDVPTDTFERLAAAIESKGALAVTASAGGGAILACERRSFFAWLGFEEDTVYAGAGSLIGLLCDRLAAAGVGIVSLQGPIPDAGLSPTHSAFIAMRRGAPPARDGLLPSLPSELIRARASSSSGAEERRPSQPAEHTRHGRLVRRFLGLWGALRYGLPPNFDRAAYLRHNPDVAKANVDPVRHFSNFGYKEGRRWTDD